MLDKSVDLHTFTFLADDFGFFTTSFWVGLAPIP